MFQHTAPQKWCQTLLDDVPKDDDERSKMREAAKVEAISVEQSKENFRLVQNLSDEFSLMGKDVNRIQSWNQFSSIAIDAASTNNDKQKVCF